MQHLCTTPTFSDQLTHLEQVHRCLPPLQDIFAGWHHAGASARSEALAQREQLLGPATLSSVSLRLLYDIASRYVDDLPERLCWHAPTMSARETQSVLPSHVLVQKTVSVKMAGRLLLWTGVGEQAHTLERRRAVAEVPGLPRRAAKQCSTNPASCHPEEEFGLLPGMVSPFLPPFHLCRLAAIVHVAEPADWEKQVKAVGVSLSLFETLILPLHCFHTILRQYAVRACEPGLRWIEIGHHHPLSLVREQAASSSGRRNTIMHTSLDAHSKGLRSEQSERETTLDRPFLLPLVTQAGHEPDLQDRMFGLASQVTWRVAQRFPMTVSDPVSWTKQLNEQGTFADLVYTTITTYLQRGLRRVLLVPWGGRQSAGSLLEPVQRLLPP